ncbi:MAG: SDR family NAD(P)-dependent oxidoreductase [Solirubrobacteraceae bacterium]
MDESFAGKTVLITGASRGQGAAESRQFADAGAQVVMCDVLDEEGTRAAAAIEAAGGRAVYRHLDVTDERQWKDAVEYISATFDGMHVLVNNAGIALRTGRVLTLAPGDLDRLIEVNLKGPLLGIQSVAEAMRESGGGAIVNIGSAAGMTGHFAAGYSMTKWALRGLTRSAALDLVGWGIRVNAVHPGIVDTPIVEGSRPFVDAMRDAAPMQRIASPEEIARVVFFLAGDGASYITGVDVAVDGGFTEFGLYWGVDQSVGRERMS